MDQNKIIQVFREMHNQRDQLHSKISDIDTDKQDHMLVLKAMENLPDDRKCYRLINGVLVEKKVGIVQPEIKQNFLNLCKLYDQYKAKFDDINKRISAFAQEHGIRVKGKAGAATNKSSEQDSNSSKGILA